MKTHGEPWVRPRPRARLEAIRHNTSQLLGGLFAAFGLAWTVTEASAFFFDFINENRKPVFVALLVGVAITAMHFTMPTRLVNLRRGSTRIQIGFGDMFATAGVRIVAVNDYFDSELGNHVSPSSLHGQLIQVEFSGNTDSFAAAVAAALEVAPVETVERPSGHSERYSIGTTAVLDVEENRYVLVVLAETDVRSLKANADLKDLTVALAAGWRAARNASGGRSVAAPLLGGGLSTVGLSEQQLATILLASLIEATGQQQIAPLVQVVLPVTLYGKVDLRALEGTT